MTMMEKVFRSGIDLTPLGFGKDRSSKPLPKGGRLISGIRGGRFLCLAGCRDAVFFEPDGTCPTPVRVSRSFRRFLALLFAAGDLTALRMLVLSDSEEEWEDYRFHHPKSESQKETIRCLRALTGIRPAHDPFGEVQAVKSAFSVQPVPDTVCPKEYETVELSEIIF